MKFTRYYSASIIKMSGVNNQHTAIWLAAMTASVNFVFTLVGVYLVEKIGRRPLILASLAGKFTFRFCPSMSSNESTLINSV